MASAAHLARLADQARTQLAYLRGILPPQLQSLLPQPAAPSRLAFLTTYLPDTLTRAISPELLLAVLLPLIVAVVLMSSWRGFLGDRYSPFTTATPHRPPPTVTDDDFQYLGPDDVLDPPSSHRGGSGGGHDAYHANASSSHGHHRQHYNDYDAAPRHPPAGVLRAHADNPDMPDVLILKHRGTTYPLHFRAFAIGEGLLCVGEVRRQAAIATNTTDPRRVRLLYKRTPLRDDARPCRDEGLKQNSEITCVVSGRPGGSDSAAASSDESADEADMVAARLDDGEARVDPDGNMIGGRAGGGRRRRSDRPSHSQAAAPQRPRRRSNSLTDDGYLFPTDPRDIGPRREREREREASAPAPRPRAAAPPSSQPPAAPPSPRAAAPSSPKPAQNPGPPPTFPKTPMGKLDEIAWTLRTTFVPRCEAFVRSPPRESKPREQEYMKLSESILAQIIFKLDEVEGDDAVKAKRRALVKETQGVLAGIDAVGKRK